MFDLCLAVIARVFLGSSWKVHQTSTGPKGKSWMLTADNCIASTMHGQAAESPAAHEGCELQNMCILHHFTTLRGGQDWQEGRRCRAQQSLDLSMLWKISTSKP